jgi:hypothetical protein
MDALWGLLLLDCLCPSCERLYKIKILGGGLKTQRKIVPLWCYWRWALKGKDDAASADLVGASRWRGSCSWFMLLSHITLDSESILLRLHLDTRDNLFGDLYCLFFRDCLWSELRRGFIRQCASTPPHTSMIHKPRLLLILGLLFRSEPSQFLWVSH